MWPETYLVFLCFVAVVAWYFSRSKQDLCPIILFSSSSALTLAPKQTIILWATPKSRAWICNETGRALIREQIRACFAVARSVLFRSGTGYLRGTAYRQLLIQLEIPCRTRDLTFPKAAISLRGLSFFTYDFFSLKWDFGVSAAFKKIRCGVHWTFCQ